MARTVLVADDSPTIQKKAQGILKGEGYEVETVSNGVAAIKKLAKLMPVVVLADVEMPGKDGYEVCDFIKNSEALRHVPVLLITSDLDPYDEGKGARVHADGKVKKPFEPQDLISVVARFAAQAEAAAPKPRPVQPAPPPPPAAFEVSPTEEEMDVGAKKQSPTFAGVSEGIAFSELSAEAAPAPPQEQELSPAPPAELAETVAFPMEAAPEPAVADMIPMEPAPAAAEPAPEELSVQAEPVLVEEPASEPPAEPAIDVTEQTMMFRTPAQFAEPVLSEEGVVAAGEEPPALEESAQAEPVTATSLESYSLSEAARGQVRMAPLEAEAPAEAALEPSAEVAPEAPPPVPEGTPLIDAQLVYSIVHRVVVKMSPPAFSASMIEEMARNLAEDVLAELQAESSQAQ